MTLQKEFYANFIVQRLTLKVINMDTLYLVFKDRFPIFPNPDLGATPSVSVASEPPFFFQRFLSISESILLRQDSLSLPYRRLFLVPSKT
jgi:hypothetical protein